MRNIVWMKTVVAASLAVCAAHMLAQADPAAAPMGQGGGMGQGVGQMRGQGRGGFGGGQMGQRVQGTVTAAAAGKLTIQTEAGDSYQVTLTDTARIMKSGQAIQLGDVKPGDSVTAMGQVDAAKKTVQATMVNDVDAATVAKAKENMGKTYITGRITAVDADNLKLTVMRTDNVSQVIAVDDGTSFQRGTRGVQADVVAAGGLPMGGGFGGGMRNRQGGGGQAVAPPAPESITLADIKVGDTLMATGAIKAGAFTVLKMGVATPGAGPGGGRRGPQDQAAPAAGAPPMPPPPPQ